MNICIVARFSDTRDEGERNVAHSIFEEASRRHAVRALNLDQIGSASFWSRAFSGGAPDIIHYLGALTPRNLALLGILRTRWLHRPRTTFSVIFTPPIVDVCGLPSLFRPDLVLCQSRRLREQLTAQGWSAVQLPNGIDTGRFAPVPPESKRALRHRYGIGEDEFVVLHVGHLKANRNLDLFEELGQRGMSGIVIASQAIETNEDIAGRLERAGCRVRIGFLPHVEEYYQLADCYLFPVHDGNSIATPLSVLEAMACGIPVVSRRFSGLEDLFADGEGIIYGETNLELITAIETIQDGLALSPRQHVERLSWTDIGSRLDQIYHDL